MFSFVERWGLFKGYLLYKLNMHPELWGGHDQGTFLSSRKSNNVFQCLEVMNMSVRVFRARIVSNCCVSRVQTPAPVCAPPNEVVGIPMCSSSDHCLVSVRDNNDDDHQRHKDNDDDSSGRRFPTFFNAVMNELMNYKWKHDYKGITLNRCIQCIQYMTKHTNRTCGKVIFFKNN